MNDKYTDIQHWIEGVQTLDAQPPTSQSLDTMERASLTRDPRVSRIKEWATSDHYHICPEELIRCVVAFVQDVVEDSSNKELRDVIRSLRGNLESLRESERPIEPMVAQEIIADLSNLMGTSFAHISEGSSQMEHMKKIFAKLGRCTPADIQMMSLIPDEETMGLRQPPPLPAPPFGVAPGSSSHNRDQDPLTTPTGTNKTGSWGRPSTTEGRTAFDAGTPPESVNTSRSTYRNTTTNESRYAALSGRNYDTQNNHFGHMNIYGLSGWPRDGALTGRNPASPTFINGSGNTLAHTMSDFNNARPDYERRRKGKGRSTESRGDSEDEE